MVSRRGILRRSKWRGTVTLDGGGALINQGVHTVDLLLWLFGDVRRVQATAATALHSIEAEDTVAAILEFASGALCVFHATTRCLSWLSARVEITGTRGTVILEQDRIIATDLLGSALNDHPDVAANLSGDDNPSASSAGSERYSRTPSGD